MGRARVVRFRAELCLTRRQQAALRRGGPAMRRPLLLLRTATFTAAFLLLAAAVSAQGDEGSLDVRSLTTIWIAEEDSQPEQAAAKALHVGEGHGSAVVR